MVTYRKEGEVMKKIVRNRKLVCAGLVFFVSVMLSTGVFAASKVARINNRTYSSLAKALSAARSGDTVTLLAPVKTSKTVTISKNVNINFANKLYTYTGSSVAFYIKKGRMTVNNVRLISRAWNFQITANGRLTIKNGSLRGSMYNAGNLTINKGTFTTIDGTSGRALLFNKGSLTIKNGTFISKEDKYAGIENSGGTAVISGGLFQKSTGIANAPMCYNTNKGKLTISGGTFKGTTFSLINANNGQTLIKDGIFNSDSVSILNRSNGVLKVNGGTIKSNKYHAITNHDGKLTVNKGTIGGITNFTTGKNYTRIAGGKIIVNEDFALYNFRGKVTIKGGTLETKGSKRHTIGTNVGSDLTITGGTIISNYEKMATILNNGKLTVSGGTITNTASKGIAIKNKATATFSKSDSAVIHGSIIG